MAIRESRVRAYTNLFKSQMGGAAIAVYQGLSQYQSWKGFDVFFRCLLCRILPIALNVAKSALTSRSNVLEQRASFTDTLRSALRLAANAAIHGTLSQFYHAQQERGPKWGLKHKTIYKLHKAMRMKPIV